MGRVAIASVISHNAYTAMLLAWVHSVAQQVTLMPQLDADIVFIHCDADVRTLETIASCVTGRFPDVRVRLVSGCVEHPSKSHPHFVHAVQYNTGHARFLNSWSRFQLWNMTEYDQVLYMDADTLLLRPVDVLLAQMEGSLSMGRVGCVKVEFLEPCNSGVVLFRPDRAVFERIVRTLDRVREVGGFLLGDQDFFYTFFAECLLQMNRTYNFADVKQGRPVPPELHVLHFQGKKGENKPVDYRAGGTLRYTRAAPEWPVFRKFEEHFAPLYACYTGAVARDAATPLFPDVPGKYVKHMIQRHKGGNVDRKARKVIRHNRGGACVAPSAAPAG
jgi:hypothetical protein